jgi:hypothetical protein
MGVVKSQKLRGKKNEYCVHVAIALAFQKWLEAYER